MTEHTQPEGRPRNSLTAAAATLSQLGRLRDLPVVLMLAWVGWLAIPWPFGGPGQARGTADQRLSAGDQRPGAGTSPDRTTGADIGDIHDTDAEPVADPGAPAGDGPGAAVATGWSLPAPPAQPPLLVKPERRPAASVASKANLSNVRDPDRRELSAGQLIAAERARIAAEVHDVAGHGLATIAMQAGVALLMLDERPDQVRESLEAIRATSTKALDQLRSALDLIDPVAPDHDLPRLIDEVRTAGLPVELRPAEPEVPAHLQDTVYRVVRESLTNVVRHAGPTAALVSAATEPGEFVLEIADGGRGPLGTAEGRGLVGMRARVTDAGGVFAAGAREGGGFRVVARFPLSAETVSAETVSAETV
ncbi:histidine kinase [Microtetraspora sp. NBRC 16547]|uniref:sensor histidine kinase n=1 Tax=Microtetraspora sp. NBRC 16547 TaxID=3030993 RepID=UPI002557BBE4|nr:histidine kinase [Microtetraspora sp. NBRC 16547]